MVEIKSTQIEKIIYKPKPLRLPTTNHQPPTTKQTWYVYLIQCRDNSLYTGVTNNLQKRMDTHKSGKGSKYVKAKGFGSLINFKPCKDKIEAQQLEYKIKQLHKSEKINWFHQNKK